MKVKAISDSAGRSVPHALIEQARRDVLLPVRRLAGMLQDVIHEHEIYDGLIDVVAQDFNPCSISIMIQDGKSGILEIIASGGLIEDKLDSEQVRSGKVISSRVLASRRTFVFNHDFPHDACFEPEITTLLKATASTSALFVPMVKQDLICGVVMIVQEDTPLIYDDTDGEIVSILAHLAAGAIETVRLKRQRSKAQELQSRFETFVSRDVARLLTGRTRDLLKIGEVRELTVLFADLRNFTSLAQKTRLQELRLFLNDFFTLISDEVYQGEGELNKFMGDGVLVVFKGSQTNFRAGSAAVETAIRIVQRFKALRERYGLKIDLFKEVELGIGISSGKLFIGNVGSPQRLDFTVFGTAVNVAQRLASHGAGDMILITDTVKGELDIKLKEWQSQNIRLKGFCEPITAYGFVKPLEPG